MLIGEADQSNDNNKMDWKMFGFLKKLRARLAGAPARHLGVTPPLPPPLLARTTFDSPQANRNGGHAPNGLAANGLENGNGIRVPVCAILGLLPLELQPRVKKSEVGAQTLSVPINCLLPQLSKGMVQIPFGQLRQAVPSAFSPENDRDHLMVPLPLDVILPQISRSLMARRRSQRRVEVPEGINSPFANQTQGLAFAVSPPPANPPAPPSPPAVALDPITPAPPIRPADPAPPAMAPDSGRGSMVTIPRLSPPSGPEPSCPTPIPFGRGRPEWSPPAPPAAAVARGRSETLPVAAPPTAPAPVPAPRTEEPLAFNLALLAELWPEAVRKEIAESQAGPGPGGAASRFRGAGTQDRQTLRELEGHPVVDQAATAVGGLGGGRSRPRIAPAGDRPHFPGPDQAIQPGAGQGYGG